MRQEKVFGDTFVHGQTGTHKVCSCIRDSQQIKAGLDSAVLPAGPVQRQKNTVCLPADFQHIGTEKSASPIFSECFHRLQVGTVLPHGSHTGSPVRFPLKNALRVSLQSQVHIQQNCLMPVFPESMVNHTAGTQ